MVNGNISNKKYICKIISLFLYLIFTSSALLPNTYSKDTHEDILPKLETPYTTERLYVRHTIKNDIDTLGELFYDKNISTKVVPEIFHSDGFESVEQSIEYLDNNFKNEKHSTFTVCLKSNDVIIGEICFSIMGEGTMNISYWLGTKYQGHGYMSELALDFIKYLFINSEIKTIHIQCLSDNEASWKICCKIADNFEQYNDGSKQSYDIRQYCKKYKYRKNLETDINVLEITKNDK